MNGNLIRKITVGRDPKDAMVFMVGRQYGGGMTCNGIFQDRDDHNGDVTYNVYVETDMETSVLWKSITGMPVMIEYDCDFETD